MAILSCNVGGVGVSFSSWGEKGKWAGKRWRGMRVRKNNAPREWVWMLIVSLWRSTLSTWLTFPTVHPSIDKEKGSLDRYAVHEESG